MCVDVTVDLFGSDFVDGWLHGFVRDGLRVVRIFLFKEGVRGAYQVLVWYAYLCARSF